MKEEGKCNGCWVNKKLKGGHKKSTRKYIVMGKEDTHNKGKRRGNCKINTQRKDWLGKVWQQANIENPKEGET